MVNGFISRINYRKKTANANIFDRLLPLEPKERS